MPPSISDLNRARIEARFVLSDVFLAEAYAGFSDCGDPLGRAVPEGSKTCLTNNAQRLFEKLDELEENLLQAVYNDPKQHLSGKGPRHFFLPEVSWIHLVRSLYEPGYNPTPKGEAPAWILERVHAKQAGIDILSGRKKTYRRSLSLSGLTLVVLLLCIAGAIFWLRFKTLLAKQSNTLDPIPIEPIDVFGLIGFWLIFRVIWGGFVPLLAQGQATATLVYDYIPHTIVGLSLIVWAFRRTATRFIDIGLQNAPNLRGVGHWLVFSLIGLCLALPVMILMQVLVGMVVEAPDPNIILTMQVLDEGNGIILMLITLGIAPIFEEVLFRGVLFSSLKGKITTNASNIIQASTFAALHFNPQGALSLFILGWILGRIRERTGSLIPVILIHAGWNMLVLLFFSFRLGISLG
tara:strand:- start:1076 stop:2299 length:1224 start_codon:yes stop_codon:yes gene_type:complete